MTNLAVRQIEFYFTVENMCRDIFMRSYMDEEVMKPSICLFWIEPKLYSVRGMTVSRLLL